MSIRYYQDEDTCEVPPLRGGNRKSYAQITRILRIVTERSRKLWNCEKLKPQSPALWKPAEAGVHGQICLCRRGGQPAQCLDNRVEVHREHKNNAHVFVAQAADLQEDATHHLSTSEGNGSLLGWGCNAKKKMQPKCKLH